LPDAFGPTGVKLPRISLTDYHVAAGGRMSWHDVLFVVGGCSLGVAGVYTWQWWRKPSPPFQYTPVRLPETRFSAEQMVLISYIRALEQRVQQRRLWSADTVKALLQGAADATVHADKLDKAREALQRAQKVFEDDIQTKNRMFYLLGALVGTLGVGFLTWGVLEYYEQVSQTGLPTKSTVILLVVFAGMGSAASVLTRLSTIDLKDELRKKMVFFSAMTRPLLAIAFASVVYEILSNNIISIKGFEVHPNVDPGGSGLIWVAAFLCGFSERFAIDILDRVPLSKPDAPGG
jgi:hypothetical protein